MSSRRAVPEAGAEHSLGRPGGPVALRRPLRVLIADGSPSERSGVRRALEDAGCVVCAEAADAPEAAAAAARERPDLCLVDTELPGGGIPTAAAILGNGAETAVVMFARSSSERDLFAALEVGACGYLTKSTDPERLALTRAADDVFVGPGARLPRGPYAFDEVALTLLVMRGSPDRLARMLPSTKGLL